MKKALSFIGLGVLILVVGYFSWERHTPPPIATRQVALVSTSRPTAMSRAVVQINSQRFSVEVAASDIQQETGLSNRDQLAKNAGMLFPFTPPTQPYFWMKDMRFPLDIIWIRDGKVIGISKNLPVPAANTLPMNLPTYHANQPIDNVLEVNASESATIQVGDNVLITPNPTI